MRGVADSLRAGRHALPRDPDIASQLAHTLLRLGNFTEARACHRWAQKMAPDNAVIHAQALVDLMIDPDQQDQDFLALSKAWGHTFGKDTSDDDGASDFFEAEDPIPKDKLTIGFILGSAGNSARGVTLSSILMQLDENRFQTVGFGVGTLSDAGNIVFQKCIGRWHDVAGVDPITLKAIIAAEEVDIIVNISGFMMPELVTLLGSRLAPCQVAWMGTPYGTGIEEVDYLLTDSFLDPNPKKTSDYTEELSFLELGSVVAFPLVSKQEELSPRVGDEFLFAADAKLHELTPPTISCWAEILHSMPEASLILLDYDFKQPETLSHLVQIFGTFGIANKVDIVDSSVSSKFFEQADVCLMPIPTPSAQVTVDALWGGCPVISFANAGRHTRESGSVLSNLGFEKDMVADNFDDYTKFALNWAQDTDKRNEFRTSVREKILTSKHFDTKARAADLQSVLETLWQKTCEKS
jgi:predicted O-linked N-acetylglucosamine transferase (SPINDLY family)